LGPSRLEHFDADAKRPHCRNAAPLRRGPTKPLPVHRPLRGRDLLQAQAALVGADHALAVSDPAISADQVAVFQALGGGWEAAPPVTLLKLGTP
jgi:hypothetical protein